MKDKKYKTILADPPWKYGSWGKGSDKCLFKDKPQNKEQPMPYPTMSIEEIKDLDVESLADKDCELYLWTTQKYLPQSFEVLESWGFKYCQTLTWCKNPMGTGQGGIFCPTTEFLILARKGKMPKVKRIDTTWWNIKRTNVHSKKPKFFQEIIEKVSLAPRIELFAREKRQGWDCFGNEVDSDVQLIAKSKTQGATPSFNKDLTATQQVASPKSASQTSLNPDIKHKRARK